MSHRIAQINSLLQTEIAEILRREIDIKDYGLITVHRVNTAPNMRSAKVYVSALRHNHRLIEYLDRNVRHIAGIVGKRVRLRVVPKILFRLDEDTHISNRIEELLMLEEKRKKA